MRDTYEARGNKIKALWFGLALSWAIIILAVFGINLEEDRISELEDTVDTYERKAIACDELVDSLMYRVGELEDANEALIGLPR